jgi:hypothetical protein
MTFDVYTAGISQIRIPVDPTLIERIYNLREASKGKKRSNRGGWQSQFYNESSLEWMKPTLELVQQAANKPGHVTYWFNINGPGHYNDFHDHGDFGVNLCGCLYLQVPQNAGGIQFKQVRGSKTLTLEPTAGDLILFPDNIKHAVLENKSSEDRISIAFNFWKVNL